MKTTRKERKELNLKVQSSMPKVQPILKKKPRSLNGYVWEPSMPQCKGFGAENKTKLGLKKKLYNKI